MVGESHLFEDQWRTFNLMQERICSQEMVYFSLLCLFAVCATFIVENSDNWALSIVDF